MVSESHLARKLRWGADLEPDDIARLDRVIESEVTVEPNTDLISEGAPPRHVHVVNSGVACRYKNLPDGRRAIVALLLPGDFCDLHVAILGRMDHSIGTLTRCTVSRIPEPDLHTLLDTYPRINRACWWATLVDEAILREWLVNVGRRTSNRQLAHLFCELYMRLDAVGLTLDHTFRLPFTQATLADILGISSVHVQRVMSNLRDEGLITLQDRILQIPDYPALARFAEFDPSYLHLRQAS